MSVTVKIEHDEGTFRREFRISRAGDDPIARPSSFDARHTYLIEQTGGARRPRATFIHRYGDPLAELLARGLAAIGEQPEADRQMFDSPEARR